MQMAHSSNWTGKPEAEFVPQKMLGFFLPFNFLA